MIAYSVWGLHLCHIILTIKVYFSFITVEHAELFDFYCQNAFIIFPRIVSDLLLFCFMVIAYIFPEQVPCASEESLDLEGRKAMVGVCALIVFLDFLAAMKTASMPVQLNSRTCGSWHASQIYTWIQAVDPMFRTTNLLLCFTHNFMIYLLCGLLGHLRIKYIATHRVLFGCGIALSVVRYLQNDETWAPKCILLTSCTVYILQLCFISIKFAVALQATVLSD